MPTKVYEAFADLGPPPRPPGAPASRRSRAEQSAPVFVFIPPEPAGWRIWLAAEYPACVYGTALHADTPWRHIPHHIRQFIIQNFKPTSR